LGGCQEYYGVEADIATYGKTLGGGLPIGLVAGRKNVMEVVKDQGDGRLVFMGGTFSANPLVMCVAKAVLGHLTENKDTIYKELNENGKFLRQVVNEFCIAHRVPVRMIGIGSMSRIIFTNKEIKSRRDRDKYESDTSLQELFYLHVLLEKGIYISGNRIIFLSAAHKKEHVERIIYSIIESLDYFVKHLKVFK